MTSSKTRLLACFITLAWIIACVPSFATPTPIPPLDPNAIGTFMAQTANVAATQTMAVLPSATFTPTIVTPRATFTESIFTVVPAFTVPPTKRIVRLQYYRVKHDDQLAMYNYKSRTFDGNSDGIRKQTPEVVPLFVQPKLTTGTGRTNVSGTWETFINALNDNDEGKLRYLKGSECALFNTAGFPQLESLTMGGNIVTLAQVQGEWGQVNTLGSGGPPSAAEVNYTTRPDVIHKFVVVGWKRSTKRTILVKPPKGDVYWPLVSGRALWIPMERLEAFPILPMDVTLNTDLYIQPTPGPAIEETRLQLNKGESTTLLQYYPSGSTVWALVQGNGWIPLIVKGQFTTTWTMATVPPP